MLDLSDITLPRRDTSTVKAVLNAYLRHELQTLYSVQQAWLQPPTKSLYLQVLGLVQQLMKTQPRPVMTALRQPTVGALLNTLVHQARPDGDHLSLDRWTRELCLLLLLELAAAGALPEKGVSVSARRWPALRHVGLNLIVVPDATVGRIDFLPGRLVFHAQPAETTLDLASPSDGPWRLVRPYHRIVDGIYLALTDNNPLSHFEAHPDKTGNTLDLGGKTLDDWLSSLRRCFELVDEYLPLVGEEMRLVLRLIVPVGWHAEKHLSASYQEAIGTVYMTLHPNEMTMVEALVHEYQHNKLNAALHLGQVLDNAFWPLVTSPVRPDPRPLHGVVLAVHAFQAVAALYEQMNDKSHPHAAHDAWQKRFRDVIRMNRAGAATVLEHGKPTATGERYLAEMRQLDGYFRDYEARHWPEAATTPAPVLPE